MASNKRMEKIGSEDKKLLSPYLKTVLKQIVSVIEMSDALGNDIVDKDGPIKKVQVVRIPGCSGMSENGKLLDFTFLDAEGEQIADAEISIDVTSWCLAPKAFSKETT